MVATQRSSVEETISQKSEVRIYYASPFVVIIDNPLDGDRPMVVLKNKASNFDGEEVKRALDLCGMELTGEPKQDENGLWYCPVQMKGG